MTTSDYLESLQDDLERIYTSLELEEGTNFTDIANMAENGDISTGGGGGADLSEYFGNTITNGSSTRPGFALLIKKIPDNIVPDGTSLEKAFSYFEGTALPIMNTSNITNFGYMASACPNLTTCPQLDTSAWNTTFVGMFRNSPNLTNIPIFNFSGARYSSNLNLMFDGCQHLSNDSLNNILASCITATRFTDNKKLTTLGLSGTYYPASTIQSLPNYQDFVNAGWTIGWE